MKKKSWLILLLPLVVVSCASPLRVHYFSGAPHYPPTAPASVDLLRFEPQRPHDAFAEIRYDPPSRMRRSEVDWKLREKGAAIGADALVIEVDTVYRERVWTGPYRVPHGRRVRRVVTRDHIIVAVAIRYH
jgi:hypothetical protein